VHRDTGRHPIVAEAAYRKPVLRKLPPLEAAEAFICAARTGSLRAAARELALSTSAASRRIQALEAFLGHALFVRSAQGLALTAAGRAWLETAGPALDAIAAATATLRQDEPDLRVAASHSVMAEWLLPRLPALQAEAGISVTPVIGDGLRAARLGAADLAIVGGPEPQGVAARPLTDNVTFLAAAPRLLRNGRDGFTLSDLEAMPRLGVTSTLMQWDEWRAQIDAAAQLSPTQLFETQHLALESAANGLGVVLAMPLVSERFFESRRLVACFSPAARVASRYWLVEAHAGSSGNAARKRAFTEWIAGEAARSRDLFGRHMPA